MYQRQKLSADISQMLHSSHNPGSEFDKVLELIGEQIGVCRVYIFEDHPDGVHTSNTNEWCNSGVKSLKEEMQGVTYDSFPKFRERLIDKGFIICKNIDDLNLDLKEILAYQNVKSFCVLPLIVEKQFFGILGFDVCSGEYDWSDSLLHFLRTIASTLSNFIEKRIVMARLHSSEIRLNIAIESAGSGLWDWDVRTNRIFHNKNYFKLFDYNQGEFDDSFEAWRESIHPDDFESTIAKLNSHLEGLCESYEATYRIRCKGDRWKWVLDKGKVVERDQFGNPLRAVGIISDFSMQKEQELSLINLNNTKLKLFSIISHDLRGPVGNMIPILDLLTGDMELDEDQQKQFLNYLKSAALSTYELLNNLLMWSKSQSDTIRLSPDFLSLQEIINNNITLATTSARNKNISISITSVSPATIYADKESVNLVLRNLIFNAIKFTPEGGKIIINSFSADGFATVNVMDSGGGISQEKLNNIFSANNFISEKGTANETGTGLGLILCKDFIERNGGTIKAGNRDEGGSIFTFTLPLA